MVKERFLPIRNQVVGQLFAGKPQKKVSESLRVGVATVKR